MSLYCRITGKSRGLPKPNYFPLLPPISPADAKKLCRITGKTCGLPLTHQYIPIPLIGKNKKSQTCPVTGKSINQPQHHFIPELPGNSAAIRHLPVSGYRYVVPVLDPTPPALQDLLVQDVNLDNGVVAQYVYTLDEKNCGLVIPATIEAAVRQGAVASMLLAENSEKLAIKLLEGTQITVKVQEMPIQPTIDMKVPDDWVPLLDGQGPTKKAIKIIKENKKKAAANAKKKEAEMESMKRVFVEKEIKAEKDELLTIIEKKPKEEIKVATVEPKANAILTVQPKTNGILKYNEPENDKPKVIKKVTIDRKNVGDEKLKMLKVIKDIYSNGDITNEEDDISEIEDFKVNTRRLEEPNNCVQTTNVMQEKVSIHQLGALAASENVTLSAPAETVTEKLLKQAANEKIKTLNLQEKLNGEKMIDDLKIYEGESANSLLLTAQMTSECNLIDITENKEKLSNHGELAEKASSLLNAINTPALRITSSQQLTGKETVDAASSNMVLNNTGDITTQIDSCSENVTSLSSVNESLHSLQDANTISSAVINDVCTGGINNEMKNGAQNNGFLDDITPVEIATDVDSKGDQKSKVLTALQQIHKNKGKLIQTTNGGNDAILMIDTHKDKKSEKKPKTDVPIKQLYKSNGSSVELVIEPLSDSSKYELCSDEHITPLPEPITIPECIEVDVNKCDPGIIKDGPKAAVVKSSVSLPPAPATCVSNPPRTPDTSLLKCIWEIAKQEPEILEKTANAVTVLTPKHADKVATLQDILKLTKNLEKGIDATLKWGDDVLHGKNVYINREKSCFVPGLKVNGNFIPGQTIDNEFVAGLTVKTVTKIGLIPGCVMKDAGFIAGINKEGKFVPGQIFNTGEKEEFVPGQTIMTPDGPRFVPGQVTKDKFVPGLIVDTKEGPKFIQGQSPEPGEFRPGKICYKADSGQPIFVPGQDIVENGETKFVPGRTLATPDGPQFVPGREVTDGKSIFVPGISVDGDFVPGTVIDTLKGEQFVEGRVAMNRMGKTRFIPGTSEKNKFITIKSEAELKSHPAPERSVLFLQDVAHTVVYGHMIQKPTDVQFYPEGSILPTKNVVRSIPGQLVKSIDDDEEPSFVPGMMIDGKFVAGQMVRTVEGTKFVPGQLVKNKTGTKFVPGQTLEDGTFVPGQVVDDKFVPGQIVQTAAGPTFIPGQVISTPEEGARFVPGRVVETSQGPHFVPGRVIEDHQGGVAFIPGRVVDTGDGPRFVAPDLESAPDGTMQYSMQSFEVSPEELELLDQQSYRTDEEAVNVDSTMLRQLARAGISIAQKTLPDVYICPVKNLQQIAEHITDRLKLPEEAHAKMTTILQKVAELGHNINTNKKFDEKTAQKQQPPLQNALQIQAVQLIESAVTAALLTANKDISLNPGEAIIQEMSNVLEESLPRRGKTTDSTSSEFLLKALYEIVSSPATLQAITSSVQQGLKRPIANKVEVLKDIFGKQESPHEKVAKISTILKKPKNHLDIGKAFKRLSIGDPDLVELVVAKVGEKVDNVNTEKQATSTLQNSIVSAVRESSERQIYQILETSDVTALKHLILQAVGLAKALGLNEAAEELTVLLEDSRIAVALTKDRTALEILQRLTLMKKLSESRPAHAQALGNLSSNTRKEDARYLKQLVRESEALLTAVREEEDSLPSDEEDYSYTNSSFNSTFDDEIISRVPTRIKSSHDIPAALFHALVDCQKPEQLLIKLLSAIGEDRLYSYDHACVILKNNIQAVIPKESSRSVLTGKASYTLIDEKGVRQFGAMDVFTALNISKPIALSRFSLYSSGLESTWGYATELPPVAEEEDASEQIPMDTDTSMSEYILQTSDTTQNLASEASMPVSECQSVNDIYLSMNDINQEASSQINTKLKNRKLSFDLNTVTEIDTIQSSMESPSSVISLNKIQKKAIESISEKKIAEDNTNVDKQVTTLLVTEKQTELANVQNASNIISENTQLTNKQMIDTTTTVNKIKQIVSSDETNSNTNVNTIKDEEKKNALLLETKEQVLLVETTAVPMKKSTHVRNNSNVIDTKTSSNIESDIVNMSEESITVETEKEKLLIDSKTVVHAEQPTVNGNVISINNFSHSETLKSDITIAAVPDNSLKTKSKEGKTECDTEVSHNEPLLTTSQNDLDLRTSSTNETSNTESSVCKPIVKKRVTKSKLKIQPAGHTNIEQKKIVSDNQVKTDESLKSNENHIVAVEHEIIADSNVQTSIVASTSENVNIKVTSQDTVIPKVAPPLTNGTIEENNQNKEAIVDIVQNSATPIANGTIEVNQNKAEAIVDITQNSVIPITNDTEGDKEVNLAKNLGNQKTLNDSTSSFTMTDTQSKKDVLRKKSEVKRKTDIKSKIQ